MNTTIKISNFNELTLIGKKYPKNGVFELTNDIDASGKTYEGSIIEGFEGILYGNGYKIYGLKIKNKNATANLIYKINYNSRIENLSFEDCEIVGLTEVGVLAGINFGIVKNCHVFNSYIRGYDIVGGLVGSCFGKITHSTVKNCRIEGYDSIGGLVGLSHDGILDHCYTKVRIISKGYFAGGIAGNNLTKSVLVNSYSIAMIQGGRDSIGGISGINKGLIQKCECTVYLNCPTAYNVGGITGTNYHPGRLDSNKVTIADIQGILVGNIVGFDYSNGGVNDKNTFDIVERSDACLASAGKI